MPCGRSLRTAVLPFAVGLASMVGCNGSIGNPEGMNGPGGSGTGTGGVGPPSTSTTTGGPSTTTTGGPNDPCQASAAFAPPRLWRLNDEQYGNVVHDVFGSAIAVP